MALMLEHRIEVVEKKVAFLTENLAKQSSDKKDWRATVGLSKHDAGFDEMIELGRKHRENPPQAGPARAKPTRAELLAAAGRTVPDVIAPGLRVLFCGINPGLYSAWAGHHFARPGNRFWPALFASGFTGRLLRPDQERQLLPLGCGITNLVARATPTADHLSRRELLAGAGVLEEKLKRCRPRVVAVLGIGAYRSAFERPAAIAGLQLERLAAAPVWVLPNPSGLNAHFTPKALARLFRDFRHWLDADAQRESSAAQLEPVIGP